MANIEKTSVDKHDGDASCIAYFNNQIFSGGADGKIKIWDNDLNLINTVDAHEAYIFALAINSSGKVYSSSYDGSVKFMVPPYNKVQELFHSNDAVQAMYCDGDILYTGDEKGVVTNWDNDKMLFKYSLVEEVKSVAAEKNLIYTVRDVDVVVSEVNTGKSGQYSNKAVMPGKSPLKLVGPRVEDKHSYLAFADRTGKGLSLVRNLLTEKFATVWNLPDCHEFIINSISGNDKFLYSGGYDGIVKGWTNLDQKTPKAIGEIVIGNCVNNICCGANDNTIYVASSDGIIRRAKFI